MSVPDRAELRQRYGDEQVLVLPAALLAELPPGISADCDLGQLLPAGHYLPRWQVEYQPKWRQLVTYIVLRQAGRLFLTERLRTQGEVRLHSLSSVGVGGHVNASDSGDPIAAGCRRELAEELVLDWPLGELSPVAVINDLSNPVSRDHLGVLFVLDLPDELPVTVRETEKMRGEMVALAEIAEHYYARLESWSQLVVDFLRKAE